MEDFKIYIFLIQKSFLCSLGEIYLIYNLHIEKKCGICLINTNPTKKTGVKSGAPEG
jgi:hypothetical protein